MTGAGVLNAWKAAAAYRAYVTITRDGMWSTRIRFRPSTPGAYLYDGVATPGRRFQFLTLRDLAIVADASAAAGPVNLFRQNGRTDGHPDQGYVFEDVRFEGDRACPGKILRIEGSANGSENALASDFELMLGQIFDFRWRRAAHRGWR